MLKVQSSMDPSHADRSNRFVHSRMDLQTIRGSVALAYCDVSGSVDIDSDAPVLAPDRWMVWSAGHELFHRCTIPVAGGSGREHTGRQTARGHGCGDLG